MVAWLLWPLAAVHADARAHVRLAFDAPEACPQAEDVLAAIDKQLAPDFQTSTQLEARGRVREVPGGYELQIDYATGSGAKDRRSVRAESCSAATQAAALFLALALAPEAPDQPDPPQPTAAANPRPVRSELGIMGQLDTALLTPNAWGAGLQVGVQYGGLRITLAAAEWLSAQVNGSVAGELCYWSVRLGACYMLDYDVVQLGPCLHGELGRMSGYAYDVADGRPDGARVQTFTAGAEGRVRLVAPVWLQIGAGFEWVQRRPRFMVGTERLYQPEALGARVLVGPTVIW
jgi:hypothetical protein